MTSLRIAAPAYCTPGHQRLVLTSQSGVRIMPRVRIASASHCLDASLLYVTNSTKPVYQKVVAARLSRLHSGRRWDGRSGGCGGGGPCRGIFRGDGL